MSGKVRVVSGAVSRAGAVRVPSAPADDEMVAGDDDPCVGDPDFDYSGGVCGECGASLKKDGCCGNRRCPYANFLQDELVPAAVWREKRQVAGNPRSRRAYPWGTRGYRRVMKAGHAAVFRDVGEAEAAGYEVRDE